MTGQAGGLDGLRFSRFLALTSVGGSAFHEHCLAQDSAVLVSFVAHEEYNLELDVNMLLMEVVYRSRLHAFPGW